MGDAENSSFLDLAQAMREVPDLEVVPDGEYELQVVSATRIIGESSKRFQVILSIIGHPNASPVYHLLWLPKDEDDEQRQNASVRKIKYFCEGFDVDFSSPIEIDENNSIVDFIGKTGNARLVVDPETDKHGERNIIKRVL